MSANAMGRRRLRVGDWQADGAINALDRAGDAVRVEPKAMEVLMVLAGRAGEVVSREELLAAVWPGVVVGDDALTQAVIKLRKALGDDPRAPSYIETISKRGYRLIAPVAASDGRAAGHGDVADGTGRSPASARRGAWLGIAAVVALALVVAAVYVFDPQRAPQGPPAAGAFDPQDADREDVITLTVLPFETLGAGSEQADLARGIGSDLMTDLSRLSELRVIGAAANATGGSRAPPNARYVVSGSVQREGGTLRVNVRLTDSRTGEQLWSERFERPAGDLLAIQNEVSRRLVLQLPGTISDAERRELAKRYTASPEAYEDFLRARALFLVRRPEENERARALYSKALDLDPQFARAYAGLAMTYAMDYRYRGPAGSPRTLDRALQLAETARTIDPGIPEVHWALGFIHAQARRYEPAIRSLERAIELNRSYADAYALMGGIYTYMGQASRSIPLLRTALRLNPDGGYLYFLVLGRAYLFQDDIQQALINLREARKRNPDDLETHVYLAAALVAHGERSAAEWEADEIRARSAHFSTREWLSSYPLDDARYRARLLDLTSKLGL